MPGSLTANVRTKFGSAQIASMHSNATEPGATRRGAYTKCSVAPIFQTNVLGYKLGCSSDLENVCNGGFHYGCKGVKTPVFPEDEPEVDICDCEGQVSIRNDCTEAFVCTDPKADEARVYKGFSFKCDPAKEIVLVDFKTMDFSCEPRPEDYVCPGSSVNDCPSETGSFEVNCNKKNGQSRLFGCLQVKS